MTDLKIKMAMWDYDRVRPILDGRVKVRGCEIEFITLPPEECFYRAYELLEFDVSEIGFVPYIIAKSRGLNPYTALPVFLSRMFRHSAIYIRNDRLIKKPNDLAGKTIGVVEYQMSAGMWCRGMLNDIYGIELTGLNWRQGGVNVVGRKEKFPLNLSDDFPLEPIPEGKTLSSMLENGELDAVISPEVPNCFNNGRGNIQRLFPDFAAVEREYYAQTGHFPIMHALGVRNDILHEHPWLPAELYRSFSEAKRLSDIDLFELRALKIGLPWIASHAHETVSIMGADFWAYGIESNRHTLEATVRYAHEQGLSLGRMEVDELFAPC